MAFLISFMLLPGYLTAQSVAAAAKRRHEAAPKKQQIDLEGKVVETINGGGYTYVKLDTAAGEVWAAIPEAVIESGAQVKLRQQVIMEKFESKALNRTFDRIVFATMASAPGPAGPPNEATPNEADAADHMASPDFKGNSVEKPAGGRTVAELWATRKELRDKEVIVRGRVVKVSVQIMGRNWVHLRDGSGSGDDATNDITVTTAETFQVGDVVTFKGTLGVDRDFGSGYRYAAIIENATAVR